MKCGVVVFPGSNCDHDCYHVLGHVLGWQVSFLWHKEEPDFASYDLIVLPGGFSYGDYLRSGAMSSFSPIMTGVKKFAQRGGLVIGICNGFQILLESGLLPGAMLRNRSLRFICRNVHVRVENQSTPFTASCQEHEVLKIPIAHAGGSYFASDEDLERLEDNGQIIFRYSSRQGEVSDAFNPNGSLNNIAGISNEAGNVLGLMPHPERASEDILGCKDGLKIFNSLVCKGGAAR